MNYNVRQCFLNNKIMSSLHFSDTLQISELDQVLDKASKTIDPSLHLQIKGKYRTFTNFNYRQAYRERKQARTKREQINKSGESPLNEAFTSLIFDNLLSAREEKKKKNVPVAQELAGVKSERRERFKKTNNTLHIIKHYIEKENFKPKQQELYLMRELAELKKVSEQTPLDSILKKIYRYMNQAVDFNELRLLCLLVILAADVCFQHKDYNRAMFFYIQAKLFASYSEFYHIKTEALSSMGNICMDLKYYPEAIKIFKKALQYAWKTKNVQQELLLYDLLGSAYYYQGNIKEAQYYHKRFTQGEFENSDSAIKKISAEMLLDLEAHLGSLQKKNITSLFIEYINIPIVGLHTIERSPEAKRSYDNYSEQGMSPRWKKGKKIMEFRDFPDALKQLQKMLDEDVEFKGQIPNPNVQRNFLPQHSFGKSKKPIVFEQTNEFHKIMKHKGNKVDLSKIHTKSLEKRIEEALSERENKDWWQQIRDKIKMSQLQKVGRMRDRVFNAHLSFYKYPQERRRCSSLKTQKIKQSFNKSLLDWIDPPK